MDPVVHFEVPADDSECAQAFYKQAFGWEFTPNPELNYTLITTSPAGEDMRDLVQAPSMAASRSDTRRPRAQSSSLGLIP